MIEAVDRERLRELIEERALVQDAMDTSKVASVREELERAQARRLQPFYIESFFLEAFRTLGGTAREREHRRYQVSHVPAAVRSRDREIGLGGPVLLQYERIAFDKDLLKIKDKPLAAFVCPGHPLLGAVIDLTLERHSELLKRGAVLVDDRDNGEEPRILFALEHVIKDGGRGLGGEARVVSQRMLYVEMDHGGTRRHLHNAPYLDYRPLGDEEPGIGDILALPELQWVSRKLEDEAHGEAIARVVPNHLAEVRARRQESIAKTRAAVKDRLTKEIAHWYHRAEQLRVQERAGGPGVRLNSGEARRRAENLEQRLQARLTQLNQEEKLSVMPPRVLGAAVVVPVGLIARMKGHVSSRGRVVETQESAARARGIVMEVERGLGFVPKDREFECLGYDIESRVPETGKLRFIEVKGRVSGAKTISVTRNEVLTALNAPNDYILAIVEFLDGHGHRVHYVRQPFEQEPDWAVTSANYGMDELIARAESPS